MMDVYIGGVIINMVLVLIILWTKKLRRDDNFLDLWALFTVFSWVGTGVILLILATWEKDEKEYV